MPTSFLDLGFDDLSLLGTQDTRIFFHPGFSFKFAGGVGQLPTAPVFYPATIVAGQPRAVGCDRQKKGYGVIHASDSNPTTKRGDNVGSS
jgi:hypothetical protein